MLTWTGQVDQPGSDTCHHYKGDMWHICTMTCGRVRSADRAYFVVDLD
jgi:hypothetical protein